MSGLVQYPVPLGHGRFCALYLPNPFTRADADRIIAFLGTLAFDEPASVNAGATTPEKGATESAQSALSSVLTVPQETTTDETP